MPRPSTSRFLAAVFVLAAAVSVHDDGMGPAIGRPASSDAAPVTAIDPFRKRLDTHDPRDPVKEAEIDAAGAAIAATWMEQWGQAPCPAGGDTGPALLAPRRQRPGEVLDVDPLDEWLGYEIVKVADLALPDGVVQESGGEMLGADGSPVPVAGPGTYPYFFAMSRHEGDGAGRPAFAQLVLDADASPVRWEEDARFGFGTDGGAGWIGSPPAEVGADLGPADPVGAEAFRLINNAVYEPFLRALLCVSFGRADGTNFVLFSNGYGDGWFPGAAGYDAGGDLVAITWYFGLDSWVLAGIPGVPPEPVTDMIRCRRRQRRAGVPAGQEACPS